MIEKINSAIRLQELFYSNLYLISYYRSLLNKNMSFIAVDDIQELIAQKHEFCDLIRDKLSHYNKSGVYVNISKNNYLNNLENEFKSIDFKNILTHLVAVEKKHINVYVAAMATMNSNGLIFKDLIGNIKLMKVNTDLLSDKLINPRGLKIA